MDEEFKNNLDYVITLCSEEICPILPIDTKKLHWINEDPVNAMLNDEQLKIAFKKTKDNIFNLLKKFMIENNL